LSLTSWTSVTEQRLFAADNEVPFSDEEFL
jgi:hypothetical protein